jgi:hypothetical protein
MIRRLVVAFAALALAATALVGTAAPAHATRWEVRSMKDSLGYTKWVAISAHDYGSYERINYIKFTWNGTGNLGTETRLLYDAGSTDDGVRLREGSSTGPTVFWTNSSWYNNVNKELGGTICHEPCTITIDLHVDVAIGADRTLNGIFAF